MHGYRAGQGAARARVLYLFRSPPNVQIGRKSMDAEVREALEHTHPDLTFDWDGLLREPMPPPRPDPRERGSRQRAQGRRDKPGRESGPSAPPPRVVFDDDTLLGRTVGAAEAARLRARHAELCHRVARRARTPEERDRLTEAAQGLNPDSWADEAAIRSGAAGLDARCDAIAAELPRRRRGRRGGKAAPDRAASGDVIIEREDDSEGRPDGRNDPSDEASEPSHAALDVAAADAPAGSSRGNDDEWETDVDPETDLH